MLIEKVLEKCSREFLLGLLAAGIGIYWLLTRSKYRLPPGPWGLPFLGYLPFLSAEPFRNFYELSKKYGNIFSLYLGSRLIVVVNDFKSLKDAYNHPDILDRPLNVFEFLPDGAGFAAHNGAEWVEQRRYSMKSMKDIGLGKSSWDSMVEAEVGDFLKFLEKNSGKPVFILQPLSASVSNNIVSLVFGKRLPAGDSRREIVDKGIEAIAETSGQTGLAFVFPYLQALVTKLGLSKFAEPHKKMVAFNNYLRNEMENRKRLMEDGASDIFIDEYLKGMKKHENDKEAFFNEKNLLGNAQALIIGGSETARTSLLWLILGMIAFPEVQKKVQEEIDIVLGKDGKCSWAERSKLPYTYATIMEAQRWRTVLPLGILHRTSADTKLCDMDIPKGSFVMSNAWGIHNDPNNWKEPNKLIPERFLNKDGSLITQKPDNYVPFSIGRRSCPGETIALIEIFQYFTALMQKFRVQTPVPGQMPDITGVVAGTYQPKPQKLVFTVRD